ncbi:SDR family NAD(P)-dependent oxidoreductase [Sphingomonas colocasiae]|uniref:SDR family oxidoreductase n=1 Tax=Sphingomonas colocasiae TaxID=1848973 RepID=A0ABS7PSM1_9SPHN|nr:SDR family NAD(P)-dependent oxidoreductase [Sphingomonas colocasiae]MBY8824293.1 SDR family oxidoreductase [Sphingomonas colocasiae]
MQRVAIVTGAAKGLGRATAERLAADGHHVVCVGRSGNTEPVATALKACGMSAEAMVAEMSDEVAIEAMVENVAARHGRIDILVNNAGFGTSRGNRPASIAELTLDEWNAVLAVNLTAPFLLSRAVIPHMRRGRWGRIVNVGSRAGRTGIPAAEAAYSATKAGLLGLTRYLAMVTADGGITVNAIAAGRFATDMADQAAPDIRSSALAGIPVGRTGDPAEFAGTVSFLTSEIAAFMTGATIDVNGGAFMA